MVIETKKKQWKLIGGYGEIGDTNWGFDSKQIQAQKWAGECRKHIGETVLLTGGGSFMGSAWVAKLIKVSIRKFHDGSKGVAVKLIDIDPPMNKYVEDKRPNKFEPWLGSWQISALVECE